MEETKVEVGQIWADCDRRSRGREIQVVRVDGPEFGIDPCATCKVIKNSDRLSHIPPNGRMVRIQLRRFKPSSTGYKFLRTPPVALRA